MKTQTYATLPDGTRVFVLDIINSFTTNIGAYPESAKVKRPLYNMGGKYIGDSVFFVETSKLTY